MSKWVMSQDEKILIECSCFKINQITPTQFVIANQNNIPLGEYFGLEEAKAVLKEIMKNIKVYHMPERNFKK